MTAKTINNLVLSGGGVKGLTICGALKRLVELGKDGDKINLDIKNILGVSVGAIIGFLYNIGYTPSELIDNLLEKDFGDLTDISILSLVENYGIDSGDSILEYIKELAAKKNIPEGITFKELYDKTSVNLQMTATNLTRNCSTIFDYVSYPDLQVMQAIRMSYSIPFVFSCVRFQDCIYVDGGLSDNYPIELYNHDHEHTFGIQLVSDHRGLASNTLQMYVYAIINCLKIQLEDKCDNETTLNINADIVSSISFDISSEVKKDLVFLGYSECTRFFD
jgi:NTE family protein